MRLRGQVIDLIRLDLLNNPDQVGRIGQIAIMQNEPLVRIMRIPVQVIDTVCIEQ